MPSFCLSKWEKGNETDKESRDTDGGGGGEKSEREVEREGKVFHLAGKQCHLLILRGNTTTQQKAQIVEEHLKHNFSFFCFYKTEAHLLSGLFYKHKIWGKRHRNPIHVQHRRGGRGELHMAEWKWVTSESFLIDQSLSKAKAEGEGKQTLQKCWFGTDTSENRLDYLIIIFAFGWRLWCECDCRGFPFTL